MACVPSSVRMGEILSECSKEGLTHVLVALSIFLCMLWRVDIKCLCFLKCQLNKLAFSWVIPAVSKVVPLFTVHFYTMLCASTTNFCRVPKSIQGRRRFAR